MEYFLMDIEKLEKLNELKEKGVLTQKEFNEEKKKLLAEKDEKKDNKKEIKNDGTSFLSKISWKNIIFSALIALSGYILFIALSFLDNMYLLSGDYIFVSRVSWGVMAVILTILSIKHKTSNYQYNAPAWVVFPAVFFFKFFGAWFAIYQLLQIKKGNAELKNGETIKFDKETIINTMKNKKVIAGVLGVIALYVVYACFFSSGLGGMGKKGFTAYLTCTYQGSEIPIHTCLGRSDLKITTGNYSNIYSGLEVAQMGGVIDLPQHFKLVTQNSHDTFLLNVILVDVATQTKVFKDSAGRYGIISVNN